jgi:hypothetical protein
MTGQQLESLVEIINEENVSIGWFLTTKDLLGYIRQVENEEAL